MPLTTGSPHVTDSAVSIREKSIEHLLQSNESLMAPGSAASSRSSSPRTLRKHPVMKRIASQKEVQFLAPPIVLPPTPRTESLPTPDMGIVFILTVDPSAAYSPIPHTSQRKQPVHRQAALEVSHATRDMKDTGEVQATPASKAPQERVRLRDVLKARVLSPLLVGMRMPRSRTLAQVKSRVLLRIREYTSATHAQIALRKQLYETRALLQTQQESNADLVLKKKILVQRMKRLHQSRGFNRLPGTVFMLAGWVDVLVGLFVLLAAILVMRVSSPFDGLRGYSDSDSDSDSDIEEEVEKLRSDSPMLRMTPKVTSDSTPERNNDAHSNANMSSTQRINSMLVLAGFEPIEFGASAQRPNREHSPSINSLNSEDAVDHVHSSILPLVHRLVTSLNALNAAHANAVNANAILRSDNSTLSDRVVRLKKGLVDKEFELTKLKELRREADDNCKAAVTKCRATEKELKTIKNDFLALVGKVGGCCNDGIKSFVNSPSTPFKRGKSEHHGLPCSKCYAKLRQSRSSSAQWIDGVGFIDEEDSDSKVVSPSFVSYRRRADTPSSPIPKRPTSIASLYSSPAAHQSKQIPRTLSTPKAHSNFAPKPSAPVSTPAPTPTSFRIARSLSSMSNESEPASIVPTATPPPEAPKLRRSASNSRIIPTFEEDNLPASIRRSSSINRGRTPSSSSLDSTATSNSMKRPVPNVSTSSKASISTMTETPPPLETQPVAKDEKTLILETLLSKQHNLLESLILQNQTPPNSFFMLPATPNSPYPPAALDSDTSPTTSSQLHDLADRYATLEHERKQLTSAATELGFERMQLKQEREVFFEEVRAFRTLKVLVGLDQVLGLENETPVVGVPANANEFDSAVLRDQEVLRRTSETSPPAAEMPAVETDVMVVVEELVTQDVVAQALETPTLAVLSEVDSSFKDLDAADVTAHVHAEAATSRSTEVVTENLTDLLQPIEELVPGSNDDSVASGTVLIETQRTSLSELAESFEVKRVSECTVIADLGIPSDPEPYTGTGTRSEPVFREKELEDADTTLVLTSPSLSLQDLSTSPSSPSKPKHSSAPDLTAADPKPETKPTIIALRPSTRNLIAQYETFKSFRPILELNPPSIIATHAVTRAFIPSSSRSDEVPLARGDLVHVERVFEDGWVKVVSFQQGAGGKTVGFVPGVCLREVTGGASRVVVVESESDGRSGKGGGVEKSWVGAVGRKAVRFQNDVVEIGKTGWGERMDSLEVGNV
ncbi:hypothetical protein HDU80_006968 [Chytriomyces hyalinus]|nr:hypothetical protein HDU80_006968 [Chytriomyces hyalinus]